MRLVFPAHFFWGTSTAAAQVETAGDHPWKGLRALDGYVFQRTTDHELRRMEDAEYIARLGSVYRCGVDWSRLQPAPNAVFDPAVVAEYQAFFEHLRSRGVELMLVLHHFCHPNWFEKMGGWTKEDTIPFFLDYVQQCISHFGRYARWWNTFNEPNVYALNAFLLGNFPPFKKARYFKANAVLNNMGKAHDVVYNMLRNEDPDYQIGISLNTAWFAGANWPGRLPAAFMNWWFMKRAAEPFKKCDFWGLSYYAYVLFDPFPMDMASRSEAIEKLGLKHDKMWIYRPEGLARVMRRFYKRYKKPIVITENGICTDDSSERIQSIRDYLKICHAAIQEGIPLKGYIHWSTWDNFEWHLGPTYRFGLVRVDFASMNREMTEAGLFYEKVVKENAVE